MEQAPSGPRSFTTFFGLRAISMAADDADDEVGALNEDLRRLRRELRDLATRVLQLECQLTVASGMTPAQRVGATAGISAALIAIIQAAPAILDALSQTGK